MIEFERCLALFLDDAYKLAVKFDKSPINEIAGKIRFWHAENDYKPVLYDELGSGAVQSIDSLFAKDQHPLNPMPDKIVKKMEPAEKYWNEVKNELIAYK